MNKKKSNDGLKFSALLAYGVGSSGVGILATAPSLLLLYYLTEILLVDPLWAGIGLFLPRLLDVIVDPLIGLQSDKTQTKWGSRKPWMLVGALISTFGVATLFWSPGYSSPTVALIHVLVVYTVMIIGSVMYAIPYIAMPVDVSAMANTRNNMIAFRLTFSMIGIFIAGAFATPIVNYFGGGESGYRTFSWFLGLIVFVSLMFTVCLSKVPSSHSIKASPITSTRNGFALPFSCRSFRRLTAAYFCHILGVGIALGVWPYFASVVLGDESALGLLFALALGGTIFSMPIWHRLLKSLSMHFVYALSACLYMFGGIILVTQYWFDLNVGFVRLGFLFSGVACAGFQLASFAMLADIARVQIGKNAQSPAGIFSGLIYSVEKAGYAFAPLILGAVLSIVSSGPNDTSINTTSAHNAIVIMIMMTAVPAVLNGLGALIFSRVHPEPYRNDNQMTKGN